MGDLEDTNIYDLHHKEAMERHKEHYSNMADGLFSTAHQMDEDEIKDRDNDIQEEIINRGPRSPEW